MMQPFDPVVRMRALPVARLLADGEMHSIRSLAQRARVDEGAVGPLLEELQALGLPLVRDDRGAVGLPGGLELLSRDRVLSALRPRARGLLSEFDLHGQIDSTNTEALRRVQQGASSGLVVSAEQQTAGRGRRGRGWISPFGCNIYVSSVWEFAGNPAVIGGLSLAVGVAVAEALAETGFGSVSLKWPNDILYGDAKLGGILIEITGGASGPTTAVIGIGLNLRMPAKAATQIDQRWTDLASAGSGVSRNALLAAVLNHLLPLLDEYGSCGLEPWRERWLSRNAFSGRQVCLQQGDRQIVGEMLGVGERGELRIDVGGCELSFEGGEVSLRAVS